MIIAFDETAIWYDAISKSTVEESGYDNSFEKFTAAGNPKSAPLKVILGWIVKAWDSISSDIIVNSFKVCGLTNNLDRPEDEQIIIFKDKKCCAGYLNLKEFWNQLDSKTLL